MIKLLNGLLLDNYEKYPLFGIILFNNAHAYVIKALKDRDFWEALNSISGDNIAIFATRLLEGHMEKEKVPYGAWSRMIAIWKEPNANNEILSWFKIDNSRELPLFILFGTNQEGLYYQKHRLGDCSVEGVYNSIKKIVTIASNYISQSRDKVNDKHILFKRLAFKLNIQKGKDKIIDILNAIEHIKSLIP